MPEVGRAYARARELCRQVDDPRRVVPVLIGLSAHHIVSGEITTSRDVALEMLDLFNRLGDPNLQMVGQWSLGAALFHLGELEVGHDHLQRALELYDPAFHSPRVWETGVEPGIFCRCELARTLTLRGYPDQGLACVLEAVAQARALEHPQPLAFSLLFLTLVHGARREPEDVCRVFDELSALCVAHGIAQELLWAVPLRGRALVELGDIAARPRRAWKRPRGAREHPVDAAASVLLRPVRGSVAAGARVRPRAAGARGSPDGRRRDQPACVRLGASSARTPKWPWRVGITGVARRCITRRWRLRGVRARGHLELRAARGYASFLVGVGRGPEARDVLQICDWFTEGRSTQDFVYAEGLLQHSVAAPQPLQRFSRSTGAREFLVFSVFGFLGFWVLVCSPSSADSCIRPSNFFPVTSPP